MSERTITILRDEYNDLRAILSEAEAERDAALRVVAEFVAAVKLARETDEDVIFRARRAAEKLKSGDWVMAESEVLIAMADRDAAEKVGGTK